MPVLLLRRIHRWLGLLLVLPLLVQGLTGIALTVEPLLPNIGAFEATQGVSSSVGAIVAAAQVDLPPGLRPSRYVPAASPGRAASVYFIGTSATRGPGMAVQVDPVSLDLLGRDAAGTSAFDWVKSLHTNLLMEGRTGRSIIGWIGVGLIALAVIGIPLWWPPGRRWRPAFTIDTRAQGHAFHRRLHGAAGIWAVLLLLATAVTGVSMAFPQTSRLLLGLPEMAQRAPRQTAPQTGQSASDIDRALAAANGAAPGLQVRAVLLPAGRADPVRVLLAPPGKDGVSTTVVVAADATGRVVSVQDPRTMSTAELALRWAHDLHFGQGFGPLWRVLTIVTGLVLPVFGITGAAMWLYRRRGRMPVLQPGE